MSKDSTAPTIKDWQEAEAACLRLRESMWAFTTAFQDPDEQRDWNHKERLSDLIQNTNRAYPLVRRVFPGMNLESLTALLDPSKDLSAGANWEEVENESYPGCPTGI